jgi:hypothetical protein
LPRHSSSGVKNRQGNGGAANLELGEPSKSQQDISLSSYLARKDLNRGKSANLMQARFDFNADVITG